MYWAFRAVVILFALSLWVPSTMSAKRVALVIGNSAYEHVSALANPKNDADDISKALEQVGFEVSTVKDLTYRKMRLALREFGQKSIGSEIALVYYAGHGIEVDRQNYLIPTDARLKSDIDVEFEAMPLESISRAVAGAKGLRLILLDACRDNPFASSMTRTLSTRSIGRGLARVEPTVGTLVSYAAKEGTVAADGSGRNSPYTSALIKHLQEPGLEVQFMFRKVRDSVIASTNGGQEPFTYGSLPGKRIYLTPEKPKPVVEIKPDNSEELALWDSIKNGNSKAYFEIYLSRYPNGLFAGVAKLKISEIAAERARQEAVRQRAQDDARKKADLNAKLALQARKQSQQQQERANELKSEIDARKSVERRLALLETKLKESQVQQQQLETVRQTWETLSASDDLQALRIFAVRNANTDYGGYAKSRIQQLERRAALSDNTKEELPKAVPVVQQPTKPDSNLVRSIQRELNRVGCNAGTADGLWGKGSRGALNRFARHGKIKVSSLDPSQALLQLIEKRKARVCPLSCRRGFEVKGGRCRAIVKKAAIEPKPEKAVVEPTPQPAKTTPAPSATKKNTRNKRTARRPGKKQLCFQCPQSVNNAAGVYCFSDQAHASNFKINNGCKTIKRKN